MNEKDLKKLSRQNLIELILAQMSRAENLQKKIEILENNLRKREIHEKDAGSIVEAAAQINNIFLVAQGEAEQYLEQLQSVNLEKQKEIDAIDAYNERKIRQYEENCRQREKQAEQYVNTVSAKVQSLFSQYRKMEEDMENIMLDAKSFEGL